MNATLLVFCDDDAHCRTPVGPFLRGHVDVDDLPDDVVIVAGFSRDEDGWRVDPFSARWGGRVRAPHRKIVQYVNAAGDVVPLWGMDLPRQTDALSHAREVAGVAAGETLRLGVRYQLPCPVCRRHEVRRGGDKLHEQFDDVVAQGVSAVSLAELNRPRRRRR